MSSIIYTYGSLNVIDPHKLLGSGTIKRSDVGGVVAVS